MSSAAVIYLYFKFLRSQIVWQKERVSQIYVLLCFPELSILIFMLLICSQRRKNGKLWNTQKGFSIPAPKHKAIALAFLLTVILSLNLSAFLTVPMVILSAFSFCLFYLFRHSCMPNVLVPPRLWTAGLLLVSRSISMASFCAKTRRSEAPLRLWEGYMMTLVLRFNLCVCVCGCTHIRTTFCLLGFGYLFDFTLWLIISLWIGRLYFCFLV